MSKPELVVAPLTPFTTDLKIDAAALKREIDYVVADCGATMVVAAGVEALADFLKTTVLAKRLTQHAHH